MFRRAGRMALLQGIGMSDLAANYELQVRRMHKDADDWLAANPGTKPLFQWNFPKDVAVAAALCDAVRCHFVSFNSDARNLCNALGWLDDTPQAPTVIMVKIALDML